MFRLNKATAMAAYFLSQASDHTLNDLTLMNLMVIAERECMAESTSLITGARFISMQNGPVLAEVLDLMQGKSECSFWDECIGYTHSNGTDIALNYCFLKHSVDIIEYLSDFEIEVLHSVWNEHGCKDKWNFVNLTHMFPEWDKTCKETRLSSPISLESIFRLGLHEPAGIARERAEEIEYFEAASA